MHFIIAVTLSDHMRCPEQTSFMMAAQISMSINEASLSLSLCSSSHYYVTACYKACQRDSGVEPLQRRALIIDSVLSI